MIHDMFSGGGAGYYISSTDFQEPVHSIRLCLLGDFRVLKREQVIAVNSGKAMNLLYYLALRKRQAVPRDMLLEMMWPDSAFSLANQSLNHLIYSLRKLLGDAIQGKPPILWTENGYCLNYEAGVGPDIAYFDALTNAGNHYRLVDNYTAAVGFYTRAVELYQGDLYANASISSTNILIERECLRTRFLTLLAHLATYYYTVNNLEFCLKYAQRLLQNDPCCEDAYCLIMRCYVRMGQRAQALRQYRLCETILRTEYNAIPDLQTTQLFDQIRLNPGSV